MSRTRGPGTSPPPRLSRARLLLAALLGLLAIGGLVLASREPHRGLERLARFPAGDYDPSHFPPLTDPLVGTNYTHRSFEGCHWDGTGILLAYHRPGVAEEVHEQLRAMRRAGIATLRLIVWHMTDIPRERWGVVPSRGGRLPEPYRGNLVAYLTETRRFGFRRVTVSFSPQWSNSPLRHNWDPGKFEENWRFVRDVRGLLKEHGPADTRIDLLNEGTPSDHLPAALRDQMREYVARLYTAYVQAYGASDVTVSTIAPRTPDDRGNRLHNLIEALASTGLPLPGWFEIHLNYGPEEVLFGLRHADSVLSAHGLSQWLVIGETAYDDSSVAARIGEFMETSERALPEVVQWFARPGEPCDVSPPYSAGAYLRLDRSRTSHRLHPRTGLGENRAAFRSSAFWTTSASASSESPASGSAPGSPTGAELLIRCARGRRQSSQNGSSRNSRHRRIVRSG